MPEGQKAGPKGRQLEVGAQRAPRLLVFNIFEKRIVQGYQKWHFGSAFCPLGILDFVLRALRVLRPCDLRTNASDHVIFPVIFLLLNRVE